MTFALCQNGCGRVPLGELVPDASDPPGRCPHCGGQTCDCPICDATDVYDDGAPVRDAGAAA